MEFMIITADKIPKIENTFEMFPNTGSLSALMFNITLPDIPANPLAPTRIETISKNTLKPNKDTIRGFFIIFTDFIMYIFYQNNEICYTNIKVKYINK